MASPRTRLYVLRSLTSIASVIPETLPASKLCTTSSRSLITACSPQVNLDSGQSRSAMTHLVTRFRQWTLAITQESFRANARPMTDETLPTTFVYKSWQSSSRLRIYAFLTTIIANVARWKGRIASRLRVVAHWIADIGCLCRPGRYKTNTSVSGGRNIMVNFGRTIMSAWLYIRIMIVKEPGNIGRICFFGFAVRRSSY